MKCVIFGGGGFIGSAIVDRLLLDGHSLRIFERPRVEPYREFLEGEQVEWIAGDLQSKHDVDASIEGMDVVLHLVSTTLPKSSNDDPVYDVQSNLVGTLQMLNAMATNGVRRIIFISSGGTVYGTPIHIPINEMHPTEPIVSYGIIKLAIEKYLFLYHRLHGIRPTILRVANPYGERQRVETAQGAVGVFLHQALRGETLEIWGDGAVTRDYIYISDVADAFASTINYTGDERLFNIGSGVGVSLNELIACMEEVLGHTIERRFLPQRIFDVPINVLDNTLAKRELKWTPKVSLSDGLQRTADWMKRDLTH